MNVIEAYIKYHNQLIVLVSGLSACGKSILAKNISSDCNISIIKQRDFLIKNYYKMFKLDNGQEVVEWDSDDAIDWDNLNTKVTEMGKSGVILVGISFPKDKLAFHPDYHFHVSISKQNCLDKREKILEENKNEYPKEYAEFKDGTAKLIMDQITYPYYKKSIENSVINKFFNSNKLSQNEMSDIAFNTIIELTEKFLYKGKNKTTDAHKQERSLNSSNIKNNISPQEKLGRPFDTIATSTDIKTDDVSMYDKIINKNYDEGTDSDETNSEETDNEETNSEETNSEEIDSEEIDSEETNSEETDNEETNSEETNSEETDNEETNSEEIDSNEVDSEEVDSNEIDSKKAIILRKKLEYKTKESELSSMFTEEASSSNTSTTDPMAKVMKPNKKNDSSSYDLDEPSEELVPDNIIEVYHNPPGFNYH